jgi:dynamin 1-like protein
VTSVDGDPLLEVDSGPHVLDLINRFIKAYGDMLDGRFVKESAVEMQGGSRINYIFHELFRKVINQIDPFEYLSDQDIQTAIKNASAMSPSLFVPEQAFEVLVRQQIARLLEPSLDCAYQVYEELRRVVIHIDVPQLAPFYKLQSRICDVMENVLDKCLTPTTEMIMNLMEIENANINTNHPDFVGSADSLLNLFQDDQNERPAYDGNNSDRNQSQLDDDNDNKTYSLLSKRK